jgi:hypothetical protein
VILNFGRYKGRRIDEVSEDYLTWLTRPVLKSGDVANIPADIQNEAKRVLKERTEAVAAMRGDKSESVRYVVDRDGDISGQTIHATLEAALEQIATEYPVIDGERQTPDPEDDRLLVWEVLPSGHRKVVWHFSGWHWDQSEYGEQGTLPGDGRSLYSLADF